MIVFGIGCSWIFGQVHGRMRKAVLGEDIGVVRATRPDGHSKGSHVRDSVATVSRLSSNLSGGLN